MCALEESKAKERKTAATSPPASARPLPEPPARSNAAAAAAANGSSDEGGSGRGSIALAVAAAMLHPPHHVVVEKGEKEEDNEEEKQRKRKKRMNRGTSKTWMKKRRRMNSQSSVWDRALGLAVSAALRRQTRTTQRRHLQRWQNDLPPAPPPRKVSSIRRPWIPDGCASMAFAHSTIVRASSKIFHRLTPPCDAALSLVADAKSHQHLARMEI